MADTGMGMDKAHMKALLVRSKKEPVNCAFALHDGQALLVMDRIKQPRALLKTLEGGFAGCKTPRFGTAHVDEDEDPKLVTFRIARAASGMARRLAKTLKGTGVSKVRIVLEDGTVTDSHTEEDGEEEGPQPATAAPGMDFGALTAELTGLVRQAAAASPAQQAPLKALAVQGQAALKAHDAEGAGGAIAQLKAALAGAADGAPAAAPGPVPDASPRPAPGAAPAPAPDAKAMAAFAKSRAAWLATRRKVEADVETLHAAFMQAFKGHHMEGDLSTAFRTRVETVMQSLDEALAHKLDEVTTQSDPARHAQLVGEARGIIKQYEAFVAGDETIVAIDENPFVPVSIRKTLTTTLTALSKAIA